MQPYGILRRSQSLSASLVEVRSCCLIRYGVTYLRTAAGQAVAPRLRSVL
jgi:hypothetical protein